MKLLPGPFRRMRSQSTYSGIIPDRPQPRVHQPATRLSATPQPPGQADDEFGPFTSRESRIRKHVLQKAARGGSGLNGPRAIFSTIDFGR